MVFGKQDAEFICPATLKLAILLIPLNGLPKERMNALLSSASFSFAYYSRTLADQTVLYALKLTSLPSK